MRIRLSDTDRERFGCGEWLIVDLGKTSNREAATVQKVLGFDGVDDVISAWSDQWKRAAEAGGDEEQKVKLTYDYDAWDAVVWLSLRHAGVLKAQGRDEMRAELEAIDYQVVRVGIRADVEPGKETESSSTQPMTSTT